MEILEFWLRRLLILNSNSIGGDVFTVQSIKTGLEEFQNSSGLSPSPNKSHIFFSGCEQNLRDEILRVCNFSEGTLPVRYLGVPFVIQFVLFSMQVFWTSLFILPKKVIRSIESLFRAFFWSGCELKKYGAKVSWDRLSPKNEGGLGFKSLMVWNKAAIAKHIWFLFSGDAKVSAIVEGTTWRWPFPSSWELMDLIVSTPSTFLPSGGSDDVSWSLASNDVLERGPWYVGGFLLILKQWHRMMKLSKEDKKTIPVWVKFYNIPLEYWDGDGLSRIASAVGVPLFMDQLTSSGSRISFARVCVNIPTDSAFLDSFVITSGEESITIHVEYQGVPFRCLHCHVVGHETKTYLSAQVEKLVELKKITEERVELDGGWTKVKDKDQIAAFHAEVLEIAKIINPVAEDFIRSIEQAGRDEVMANSPKIQGGKGDGGTKVGSSTKQKSSGRTSGSQRKKKRYFYHVYKTLFGMLEGFGNMGVLETKIKMENEAKLFEHSFRNWKFLSNSQPNLLARIWICWDPNFCDILVVQKSNQFIFVKVTVFESNFNFFATFVYAENKHELRLSLFCDLKKIAISHANHPSIFLGDFNAVRFSYEKIGGKEGWCSANDTFNNLVLDSELEDLCYNGCQFTWSNKRGGGNFITSKLDRVVNERWLTVNPNSYALFLPLGVSDHSPVIVHLGPEEAKLKKPFKFFDFWADHVEFLPRVHGVWRKYIRGSPMFRVCQKLKTLKPILKALNKKEFSEISTRVGVAKDHLLNSQIKLDKDPMNLTLQEEERAAYGRYVDLSKVEESLAHQKSRVQWLGLGDRNSKFFFRTVKGNVNRGRIHSVVLPSGVRATKSEEVHKSFVDSFTNLFGKPFVDHYNGLDRIRNLVTKRVFEAQYQALAREATEKEITDAFKSLKANKVPGPDGFSAGFFFKAWDVVGREVVEAIKSFFTSGELLQELNSTSIALIPKIPNAEKVGDFRPISCCNTLYKCISKIITDRIKIVLHDLIDLVQSAFVLGRRIADNIFLSRAYEGLS
ncbi:uncharacterized protein LOC114295119 [Camellia sinensis]|uniref:uncharacterized protein LOC114295119 n=1 Tax=Camellia sinensis TaxID=4442 RepID=UPI0010365760|nr:uncharacterized protein LOC114295119 [Camellia sinensis]